MGWGVNRPSLEERKRDEKGDFPYEKGGRTTSLEEGRIRMTLIVVVDCDHS